MIPIEDLKVGTYYKGRCASGRIKVPVMMWDGEMFRYFRHKYGAWMMDTMHHESDPERPKGIEGFIPLRTITGANP